MGLGRAAAPLDITRLQPPGVTESLALRMMADLRGYWDPAGGLDAGKVESVGCSLCGALCPTTILFVRERFPYRKCPGCGLVYPSPRPRAAHIREQYVSGRFASTFHDLYLPSAAYRMATIFRERVEEIIAPRVPRGRLLDVGCGSGHFLKVAVDYGYDGYGVEPNPEMVRFAADELGLRHIRCGPLSETDYPPAYFDVVTLWDVLEHVERPGDLLTAVRGVLKRDGWVFAYTENWESFNVLVAGEYSEMVAPDVHLRHYSPLTFRGEFERAGFRVEAVYTKGLDLAHIRKTIATFPGVFPRESSALTPEGDEAFQELINRLGKGDNLRLYARRDS